MNGSFTRATALVELKSKYQKKEDIEYEAIICANDLMGMAVLDYFAEVGIKVPSEMKVFGFDNTSHSVLSVPSLSTIDQNIEEQGYAAAELGFKLLKIPIIWIIINNPNVKFPIGKAVHISVEELDGIKR